MLGSKVKNLRNVFALDLGTTKFCLAALRESPSQTGIMADTVSIPAEGMRRGMLADLSQVKPALAKLTETAERHFDCDIANVTVGIAGSHLKSRIITAVCAVEGGVVTGRDLQRLVEQVEADNQSETRELLHVVPVGYRLDQRDTIDHPIGFNGKVLAGDFFLIDADKFYLKDIVEVCNASGLQVARLYSEPFASASVTIPDAFKQMGVVVCDIGGGTTDGLIYRAGRPAYSFTVNVAGKLMTSDLAIGLNISLEDAEMIKIRYGIKPRDGDVVDLFDVNGNRKVVTPSHALPILVPRIHELCALIAREIQPHRGAIGAGLVLTGGAAGVKGICEFFQAKLNIPVTRARPYLPVEQRHLSIDPSAAMHESPHPSKHATVLGLLNLELNRLEEAQRSKQNSWSNKYFGGVINWFRELS